MTALVDGDWLEARLGDPDVRVLHVDWEGREAYEAGHIPGSLGFNWKTLLWDSHMRDFPEPGEFARRMGALGIGPDSIVVVCGSPVQFGVYAWWALRYCGHADVRLLDGAMTRWAKDGRPMTTEEPELPAPVAYAPVVRRDHMRALRDEVRAAIGQEGWLILDHRSPEEYRGERVGVPGKPNVGAERAGRIPGARHVPFESLLNEDRTFRDRDALAAVFAAAGAGPGDRIISYCRLAHRAALASFVMTELLGYRDVRVYDGSWTEWGSLVGVPIER